MVERRAVGQTLWRFRKQLIVLLTPLLLLPLPLIVQRQEAVCGYCMLLMAVFWCTEAVPLAVTSLIPIFLFPLLGILDGRHVAAQYFKDIAWLFAGGLMVALAIERSNLHRRLALGILVLVGTQPAWLLLGFMLPTWFLSMWISNTATTSMMIPIVEAVLVKLEELNAEAESKPPTAEIGGEKEPLFRQHHPSNGHCPHEKPVMLGSIVMDINQAENGTPQVKILDCKRKKKELEDFGRAMTLGLAYAANVGGMATLTGTIPNIIMKDAADLIWNAKLDEESPLNFASWMVFCFPISIIYMWIIWAWLTVYYLGPRAFLKFGRKSRTPQDHVIAQSIAEENDQLPPISFQEKVVGFLFVVLALLWFFRNPGFIPGWGSGFPKGVKDSAVAILIPVVLFFIPSQLPKWSSEKANGPVQPILTWDYVEKNLPWGVLILIGGGMALGEASVATGLSDWISQQLTLLNVLPPFVMVTIVTLIVSFLTETTSNTATCTIVMPICASIADGVGLHPLYMMFPVCLGTSLAFMLPVATPPNAIVFAYKRVSVLDMVKAGILLKLLVIVPTLGVCTWGKHYFHLDILPWNSTVAALSTADVINATVNNTLLQNWVP